MTTNGISLKAAAAVWLVTTACAGEGLNRWAIVATDELRTIGLSVCVTQTSRLPTGCIL